MPRLGDWVSIDIDFPVVRYIKDLFRTPSRAFVDKRAPRRTLTIWWLGFVFVAALSVILLLNTFQTASRATELIVTADPYAGVDAIDLQYVASNITTRLPDYTTYLALLFALFLMGMLFAVGDKLRKSIAYLVVFILVVVLSITVISTSLDLFVAPGRPTESFIGLFLTMMAFGLIPGAIVFGIPSAILSVGTLSFKIFAFERQTLKIASNPWIRHFLHPRHVILLLFTLLLLGSLILFMFMQTVVTYPDYWSGIPEDSDTVALLKSETSSSVYVPEENLYVIARGEEIGFSLGIWDSWTISGEMTLKIDGILRVLRLEAHGSFEESLYDLELWNIKGSFDGTAYTFDIYTRMDTGLLEKVEEIVFSISEEITLPFTLKTQQKYYGMDVDLDINGVQNTIEVVYPAEDTRYYRLKIGDDESPNADIKYRPVQAIREATKPAWVEALAIPEGLAGTYIIAIEVMLFTFISLVLFFPTLSRFVGKAALGFEEELAASGFYLGKHRKRKHRKAKRK